MFKLLRRDEKGLQTIGVAIASAEGPWMRKGVELRLWTPARGHDCEVPFRFVAEVVIGPGAGYKGGAAAFFALNCVDKAHGLTPDGEVIPEGLFQKLLRKVLKPNNLNRKPVQASLWTRNGNAVPYVY
jgi:hypothetical protein